jgi:hypothetical protein
MKQFRNLATRVLIPLALMSVIAASAMPASAASLHSGTTTSQNSQGQNTNTSGVGINPTSISW